MKTSAKHRPGKLRRTSARLAGILLGFCAGLTAAADSTQPAYGFMQAEGARRFLAAEPLLDLRALGLSIGVEHTLRLPSGTVVTRGAAWSAEVHAAAGLAGGFSVPGFSVPSLHGTWRSRSGHWQASLSVTDPTRENLFINLADLSVLDANRMRLLPDRHWWFGFERRF